MRTQQDSGVAVMWESDPALRPEPRSVCKLKISGSWTLQVLVVNPKARLGVLERLLHALLLRVQAFLSHNLEHCSERGKQTPDSRAETRMVLSVFGVRIKNFARLWYMYVVTKQVFTR